MGKYGKITEALAVAGRRMEALEAKMAEARAKYEEALTQQAEREEAANDMRRELLGRHAWRYCRAGQRSWTGLSGRATPTSTSSVHCLGSRR